MPFFEERTGILSYRNEKDHTRLRYDAISAPKPFLHPLCLPDGTPVTELEPADHTWHRGLWFAFKFINGVNYWEEPEPGSQQSVSPPQAHGSTLHHELHWTDRGLIRLKEHRTLQIGEIDDVLIIDWDSQLTAEEDITLDRTPFTTWGGYGGLVVRMRNDLIDPRICFPKGITTQRPTGERYAWGGIEGTLPSGGNAAVVFLPDAENPRYPEPFYGAAKTDWNFFGGAPLFHEPLCLKAGEQLRHRARVLVLPRRITDEEVESLGTIY